QATLAGKGDNAVGATVGAAETEEAAGEVAAAAKRLELAHDEWWKPVIGVALGDALAEGREVVSDELCKQAVAGV
ncbi:MAG: hypothetical protein ACI9WU_002480, partial [Myxococcota bacterium]